MRMKFLFINPWIVDFTAYDLWIKPIGLLYIASILKKLDVADIYLINCLDESHPSIPEKFKKKREDGTSKFYSVEIEKPEFLKWIPKRLKIFGIPIQAFDEEIKKIGKVDGVFITSFMTYWYPGVQIAIERVKRKIGSIPVVLGGIYPTLIPEHAKEKSGADFIVTGEGENQLGKILEEVFSLKINFDNFFEIDSYPFPHFSLLKDKTSLPFLTSRGCPFRCSYCASFLISKKFRERSVENCLEELIFIKNNFETKHIAFYDDALLLNPQNRIKPLLRKVIEKSLNFQFHTPNGLYINEIDEELAILMKRANFKTVRLSLESAKIEFLKETKSEHKIGDLKRIVRHFENAGYKSSDLEVYILVGLPFQSAEEVEESIKYSGDCGVRVRFSYFSPIPKTEEWKKMVERGFLREDSDPLLHNKILFPYLWSPITPDKLEDLKKVQKEVNSFVSPTFAFFL